MDKKNLATALTCYILWGILPAYWNLLSDVDSLLILCCRIVFSMVLMIALLGVSGRMHVFWDAIKNRSQVRYLIPAGIIVTANWGTFIWAVNAGHVLDCSLGYYMNPLIVFALGVILFREKCTKLQLVAVAFAVIGVLISVMAYGSFPYIAVVLAVTFGVYGTLKKMAHADPVAGIVVETLVVTPFAVAAALIFKSESIGSLGAVSILLLVGGGVATAIPMVLYSTCVNKIPFIVLGFLQYISPTIALVYGLMIGETLSQSQLISFIFIGIGLVAFSAAMIVEYREKKATAAEPQTIRNF